jgi:hypothetical protein
VIQALSALVVGVNGFDAGGYLVAFIFTACLSALFTFLYAREVSGRRRPYYLFRFKYGIIGALFLALLTGLRRFVLHQ